MILVKDEMSTICVCVHIYSCTYKNVWMVFFFFFGCVVKEVKKLSLFRKVWIEGMRGSTPFVKIPYFYDWFYLITLMIKIDSYYASFISKSK